MLQTIVGIDLQLEPTEYARRRNKTPQTAGRETHRFAADAIAGDNRSSGTCIQTLKFVSADCEINDITIHRAGNASRKYRLSRRAIRLQK